MTTSPQFKSKIVFVVMMATFGLISSQALKDYDCKITADKRKAPDPGCQADHPARCQGSGAGTVPYCQKVYSDCPPSGGCIEPSKPLRCTTGECVSHIGKCPYDLKSNESIKPACDKVGDEVFERCDDGFCRPKGACICVKMSGCPFGKTQCPSSQCVYTLNECGGLGNCNVKNPWYCGGGLCEEYHSNCADRISHASFPRKSIDYDGKLLNPSRLNSIDKSVLKNTINSKGSAIIRFNFNIFYPNEISPFYTIDPVLRRPLWSLEQEKNVKPVERILSAMQKRTLQSVTPINPAKPTTPTTPSKPTSPTKPTAEAPYKPEQPSFLTKNKSDYSTLLHATNIPNNEIPWRTTDRGFKLNPLLKPAKLNIEYVTTDELKKVKILIPAQDLYIIRAWWNEALSNSKKIRKYFFYNCNRTEATCGAFGASPDFCCGADHDRG
jgi:hypothetical protein